jgi:hypothetical protein
MTNQLNLVGLYYTKLVKSLKYLEFTFDQVKKLSPDPKKLKPMEFQVWDSFVTRFARSSDLFLSKYLRAFVKKDDPAFDGAFRDFLNRGEKLGLLKDTDIWLEIRDLRNVAVHEYNDEDLVKKLKRMAELTPLILDLVQRIQHEA